MRRMSRPLSPFIRHLGEAKHRTRQLVLGVERVQAAAIAVAGETGDAATLQREIDGVRAQLALLEALAARWERERGEAPRVSRSAGVREEIAEWLGRGVPRGE
jgi:hypothetical protein